MLNPITEKLAQYQKSNPLCTFVEYDSIIRQELGKMADYLRTIAGHDMNTYYFHSILGLSDGERVTLSKEDGAKIKCEPVCVIPNPKEILSAPFPYPPLFRGMPQTQENPTTTSEICTKCGQDYIPSEFDQLTAKFSKIMTDSHNAYPSAREWRIGVAKKLAQVALDYKKEMK